MKVFFEEKHDYSGLKNIIGDTIERNRLLRLKNGDRVLLKPNLLTDKPLAISKHEMIKAVAEVFIEMGAHVDIADSPGNASKPVSPTQPIRENSRRPPTCVATPDGTCVPYIAPTLPSSPKFMELKREGSISNAIIQTSLSG